MKRYFARGGQETSSLLTKARYDVYVKHGLSTDSIAHFELSSIIGLLINATPSVFWLIFHIYSTPGLLEEIRQEIANVTTTTTEPLNPQGDAKTKMMKKKKKKKKKKTHSISVSGLRDHCPLLLSTYRETLRLHTNNVYTRYVRHDTLLPNNGTTHLLKAGSIVQIPGASMHADPSLWGPDVHDFNPRRFIINSGANNQQDEKATPATNQNQNRQSPQTHHRPGSFRSFGGGKSLCPGRHFALLEIVSAAAMVVMRYDMIPSGSRDPRRRREGGRGGCGGGEDIGGRRSDDDISSSSSSGWKRPKSESTDVVCSISPPTEDFRVFVETRAGFFDGRDDGWVFGDVSS